MIVPLGESAKLFSLIFLTPKLFVRSALLNTRVFWLRVEVEVAHIKC